MLYLQIKWKVSELEKIRVSRKNNLNIHRFDRIVTEI